MSIKSFFEIPTDKHIGETEHFFLIRDGFAVSPGHTLIISKVIRTDYFELTFEEKADLDNTIQLAKRLTEQEFAPDGYNIGMNCGKAAGQTVFHFHCHLIPRYRGDMEDPRGGVRHVIPSKGSYNKIDENNVKQNLLDWTSTFCPNLYLLLKDNEAFWIDVVKKFSLKLDNANMVINASGQILIENSFPVLLGKAYEGQELFASFLNYLDHQIKFLYESAPTNLKSGTVKLFKRLFLEFDIKEQYKPNPTYLNGISEILTINKLIASGDYTLVGIEESLENGKNADFTLIKNGESDKKYVEIVNIHIDSTKVQDSSGFTLFMNIRLQKKYDDKTAGLSKNVTKHFYLMPCIWSDDSIAHHIEEYSSASQLKEINVLPLTQLVQYNNGDKKGFHFGIINSDAF